MINYRKDQHLVFNNTEDINLSKGKYSPFNNNKNKDWYKHWCDIYCGAFGIGNKRKEEKFYRIYRGQRDEDDIKYITQTYGSALPVPDMPHIPLIRRYIDHLSSVSQLRPLVYNIFTTDVDAVKENDTKLLEDVVKSITEKMMSSMQKEMGGNPEEAQKQQAELQETIKKQTERLKSPKIVQEKMASKCLDLVINRLNLKQKWATAFLDKLITGKQYYRCRISTMGQLPEYTIINPKELSFPQEDVENLNECSFVVRKYYLSVQEVYTKYGHLLTKEDESNLSYLNDMYLPNSLYTDEFEEYIEDVEQVGYLGSASKNLVEIFEVEGKINKKIPVKELDGKLEILSSVDGLLEDEKNIKFRYYQELHTCTRINNNIYVKYGVIEHARRNPNNISEVYLSYNGRLYNSRNAPALSLVKELEDLQLRYDILWYKMFEIISLSGVKGATIIKELIPDGNLNEWIYYRRLGLSQLSIGEGQDKLISQLGQIASTPYDDTLPPQAIQSLIMAITQIEKTVGDICGIPPQALGQTQQYETKANTELSVAQGTITVENIHKDHSIFIRQSLEDLLHWSKITLSTGDLKDYLFTQSEQQMNNIEWNWIDYGINISDGYKEEKNLRDVKSVVAELVKSQQITMDVFTKAQGANTVNEVQAIIDIAVKDMKEMQQQGQKAEQDKVQGELKMKQTELQIKQEELKQKTQLETNKLVQDKELKQQEIDIKDRLATTEEQYVRISQQELENNIVNTNQRTASKENNK